MDKFPSRPANRLWASPIAFHGPIMGGKRQTIANLLTLTIKLESNRMEESYRHLRNSWEAGDRDRERALQLIFYAWMHWAEPPFVTGMSEDPRAVNLWIDVFDYFGGEKATDAEFLHVAGMMVDLFPWALGDENTWAAIARRMILRSIELCPEGFPPELFEGRCKFGEYFAHQARNTSILG